MPNKRYDKKEPKKSINERLADALHLNPDNMANTMTYLIGFVVLIIIYIANAHYHVKTMRDINETKENLREIQAEYVSLKAELATKTKASELAEQLKGSGVKELRQPPYLVKKNKK